MEAHGSENLQRSIIPARSTDRDEVLQIGRHYNVLAEK